MRNTADVTGGKPIAVLLQDCILGVSAINPLVAFYDIHGGHTIDTYEFIICGCYACGPIPVA
jgi:hypothetical protein